MAEFV